MSKGIESIWDVREEVSDADGMCEIYIVFLVQFVVLVLMNYFRFLNGNLLFCYDDGNVYTGFAIIYGLYDV